MVLAVIPNEAEALETMRAARERDEVAACATRIVVGGAIARQLAHVLGERASSALLKAQLKDLAHRQVGPRAPRRQAGFPSSQRERWGLASTRASGEVLSGGEPSARARGGLVVASGHSAPGDTLVFARAWRLAARRRAVVVPPRRPPVRAVGPPCG